MSMVEKYFAIQYYAEIIGLIAAGLVILLYVVVIVIGFIKKKLGR